MSDTSRSRRDEINERAEKFHSEHPQVWELFVKFSFVLINEGYAHHSADFVFHLIRWETRKGGSHPREFKLNSVFVAWFSRRFAELYPQHAKFFRTRKQKSASRPPRVLPEMTPQTIE